MADKNNCDYIEIERRAGSLECISDFIQERSLSIKLGFRRTWELMLVIDEICSNILSNSMSSDNTLKIIWRYDGNNCVTVEILDRGFPYNPLNPSPEEDEKSSLGEMGTYLIDEMVDRAEYQRVKDTNRICIVKCRRKTAANKKSGAGSMKNGDK
ncbi:MAG: ATP-binding protein [Candidatus Omnitrophica bacterium]|nr:ATP-binding protein [Candidatus Omnitrophota bacterium]